VSKTRRPQKPKKEAPKGQLKQPRPVWFVTLMAFVLPGSGQWLNGAPARGVIMQFGMVFGGYITYQITTPDISPVGRLAGGLLVWVFSIVDAHGIATRRVKAWARIEAEQKQKDRSAAPRAKGAGGTGGGKAPGGAKQGRRAAGASQRPATSGGHDT
jgi:hypothetical protein